LKRFKALDLAKELRIDGLVCPECRAHLRAKRMDGETVIRLVFASLVWLIIAIPVNTIWRNDIVLGAMYFIFIIIGSGASWFFLVPKHIRKQNLEVFSTNV